MADYEAAHGDVRVRIDGIRAAVRALDQAGADVQDMRDLMHSMGEIVAQRARGTAPVLTGALRGNIRAGRGKTKAVVRAGGARLRYAPVIEYGWPKRGITARPFLTQALQATLPQVLAEFDRGLNQLLRKNGLI